jgi:hypothetical protein
VLLLSAFSRIVKGTECPILFALFAKRVGKQEASLAETAKIF